MKFKLYILISIILNVLGQFVIKYGLNRIDKSLLQDKLIVKVYHLFTYPYVMSGLLIYAISAVFWILALSKIELSVAYPMLSIGYVLVMLVSFFFLNEQMSLYKILGTLLVISGVILIQK